MPNKKIKLSSIELRRLEKEVRKAIPEALFNELKEGRNFRVRRTPNKGLEITIEL